MDLKSAIEVLKLHNQWRRDDTGECVMMQPKIIGEAIDVVVSELEKTNTK